MSWLEAQAAFAESVCSDRDAISMSFQENPARTSRGLAVYRNNHQASLVEALRDSFPVTAMLVGDDFFQFMARKFIEACPPESPVLLEYGHQFPGFITTFPAATSVPYLADVARLESSWQQSYHSSEYKPIATHQLVGVPTERLAQARLRLHPSVRFLRSPFPVASIWAAHRDHAQPEAVNWASEDVLIVRPHTEVVVSVITPGEMEFLSELSAGSSVESAAERAQRFPGFDAGAALVSLVNSGVVTEIVS